MIRDQQISNVLKSLFRIVLLVVLVGFCGYYYFLRTASANMICSRQVKYDVVRKSKGKFGPYSAMVYLPKYSYSRRNLSEVFTCIINDNPTHDSFYIQVYTKKDVMPVDEACSLSFAPLVGLEGWDAIYISQDDSRNDDNRKNAFRYRPILWFPFYHRNITLANNNE